MESATKLNQGARVSLALIEPKDNQNSQAPAVTKAAGELTRRVNAEFLIQ